MGNILEINAISDNRQKAKEITSRVLIIGCKEGRAFGDILQEELDNLKKEATKSSAKHPGSKL